MDLSVCAAVEGLDLELFVASPESDALGGYRVRGRPGRLEELMGREALEGDLSPLHEVTIPQDMREGSGVPLGATHFAFAYPIRSFERRFEQLARESDVLRYNPANELWVNFLLVGGFVYIDLQTASSAAAAASRPPPPMRQLTRQLTMRQQPSPPKEGLSGRSEHEHPLQRITGSSGLLQVNALTLIPTSIWLHLDGPYPANPDAVRELHQDGRLKKVTLDALESEGYAKVGWVRPLERPGGHALEIADERRCGCGRRHARAAAPHANHSSTCRGVGGSGGVGSSGSRGSSGDGSGVVKFQRSGEAEARDDRSSQQLEEGTERVVGWRQSNRQQKDSAARLIQRRFRYQQKQRTQGRRLVADVQEPPPHNAAGAFVYTFRGKRCALCRPLRLPLSPALASLLVLSLLSPCPLLSLPCARRAPRTREDLRQPSSRTCTPGVARPRAGWEGAVFYEIVPRKHGFGSRFDQIVMALDHPERLAGLIRQGLDINAKNYGAPRDDPTCKRGPAHRSTDTRTRARMRAHAHACTRAHAHTRTCAHAHAPA